MQRNQRISSRSAIPTRERLASREPECTCQNLRGRRAARDSAIIPRNPADAARSAILRAGPCSVCAEVGCSNAQTALSILSPLSRWGVEDSTGFSMSGADYRTAESIRLRSDWKRARRSYDTARSSSVPAHRVAAVTMAWVRAS